MKILVLLALFYSLSCMANGFIGNGGDGVEIDGKLYLRDLVSLSAHTKPYIGRSIDPYLPDLPTTRAMSFPYPRQLLARKLTELNRAAPGLGDFLSASINLYVWQLSDFPLRTISSPDGPLELPPGAKTVQIANRLGTTIRIHRASWARLDEVNKVALLLHEATYSLVRPRYRDDQTAYQPSQRLREIVGAFFTRSFFARNSAETYAELARELEIPATMLPLDLVRHLPSWTVSIGDLDPSADGSYNMLALSHDFRGQGSKLLRLREFTNDVCRRAVKLKLENIKGHYQIGSLFSPRQLRVELRQYRTGDEEINLQSYVSVSFQPDNLDNLLVKEFLFFDFSGCIEGLSEHLGIATKN